MSALHEGFGNAGRCQAFVSTFASPVIISLVPKSLRAFIRSLADTSVPVSAFNQYAHHNPAHTTEQRAGNQIRRENLLRYLTEMQERRPTTLMVGEAPSHRGARLTGIPFCSETIMLSGIDEIAMFGQRHGYRKSREQERISTEASATIVWQTIRGIDSVPLLWNAFPFHPFKPQHPFSNRLPTREELRIGQPFLRELANIFGIRKVVAIGNSAAHSLELLNIPNVKIRHPSQGGKAAFVAGAMRELIDLLDYG